MKKIGIISVTLLSFLFVVWCFLQLYSLTVRQRARQLIRASYEFSERRNPPSLEEIRQVFGSALQQLGPCTRDGCGYEVNVSNRLLYRLHLAPYTNLRTQFWEENGVMQSNSVEFWTLPHDVVLLVKYCTGCDLPNVRPFDDHSTEGTGYVEIDAGASADARNKAFGFDTKCLTRRRGCASIAQLLPTAWQRIGQNTVKCIIPNREGVFDLSQGK